MEISNEDKKIIDDAYDQMESGLEQCQYAKGKSFGQSIHNAQQYMTTFVNSRKSGAVTEYLRKIHDNKSKELAKKSMTDPMRNCKISVNNDEQRSEFFKGAQQKVIQAIGTLKNIIEKYRTQMQQTENGTDKAPQRSQQAMQHGPQKASVLADAKSLPVNNPAGNEPKQMNGAKFKHGQEKLKEIQAVLDNKRMQMYKLWMERQNQCAAA